MDENPSIYFQTHELTINLKGIFFFKEFKEYWREIITNRKEHKRINIINK